MSLPIPSSAGTSHPLAAAAGGIDPKQLQAMDAPLIALTQQCGGDLRRLMFAFFSFLHRRTDFYLVPHDEDIPTSKMGFKEGDAEKLLLAAFRQFPLRKIPKGGPPSASSSSSTNNNATNSASKKSTTSVSKVDDKTTSADNNDTTALKESDEKETAATSSSDNEGNTKKKKDNEAEQIGNMIGVKYNEEGQQIPVGNGGSTPRYKWTQTIDECSVLIGVPKAFRGKDLDVKMTASTLTVKSKIPLPGEKEPRTFVDGNLFEKIRVDESTWSVEGGVVIVTLDKVKKTFWATIIQGDEAIDTDLVDSRRHISEYDAATQGQIRKIIFDQEQYHKGLPSSDEILGTKPKIPPLPKGVEYIDKKKLDEEEAKAKAKAKSGE